MFLTTTPIRLPGLVEPEGDPDAQLALIGEAPGEYESVRGRPFVGPAGSILDECLQAAGIFRRECYIDNYLRTRPKDNNIEPWFSSKKRVFTAKGWEAVLEMRERLPRNNVTVPLGNTALAALTYSSPGDVGRPISTIRGYFVEGWDGRKLLPTLHPSFCLRGNYSSRYIISWDLKKAKSQRTTPDLVRPTFKTEINLSFTQVCSLLDELNSGQHKLLSFDIEVSNYEVTCLSFAWDSFEGVSIAFDERFYVHEEAVIWRKIAAILENPAISKLGHNIIFDSYFLAMKFGIFVSGFDPSHEAPAEDTMILHHCAYPDMRKSLGFVISLYGGTAAYHKDMVHFKNIKEES